MKIFLVIIILLLNGCAAGKPEKFIPSVRSYNCNDFTIQPEWYINSGYQVLYYVIPLSIQGPTFETENNLEVPISIYSRQNPISDSGLDRAVAYVNGSSQAISPYKVEVLTKNEIPSKPWYFKRYLFYFRYDRDKVESYKFNFPENFNGCNIPDIYYEKYKKL
jgi:hypothetical protein